MNMFLRSVRGSCLLLVGCILLSGTVLADIPPPPPEIPGTRLELPSPLQMLITGAALSIAVFAAASLAAKKGTSSGMRTWGVVAIAIISFLSVIAAVYAEMEHAAHAEEVRRDRNRPRGPVPEPDRPEDVLTIPQPSGEEGSVAAEAETAPED